jgi:hypothetical protein
VYPLDGTLLNHLRALSLSVPAFGARIV